MLFRTGLISYSENQKNKYEEGLRSGHVLVSFAEAFIHSIFFFAKFTLRIMETELQKECLIMNENRNAQIENFLEKWNEMLKAANGIEGFTWRFEVSITSDNSIIEDRVKTINGINAAFTKNNMTWTSNS